MMRWVRVFAVLVACGAAGLGQAQAPALRLALVIGNGGYLVPEWVLKNPVSDARLIEARLKALRFEIIPLYDGGKAQMDAAMKDFGVRLRQGGPEAVGLFYYAGHAAEQDGANVLVPVDITARTMDELRYRSPPAQLVLNDMADARNAVNIVILDACRNLPLSSGTRAVAVGGLAEIDRMDQSELPDNVVIVYSTSASHVALDNPDENDSVFTRILGEELATHANDVAVDLFREVTLRVSQATHYQQVPEFHTMLRHNPVWRFAPQGAGTAAPTADAALLRRAAVAEASAQALGARDQPGDSRAPYAIDSAPAALRETLQRARVAEALADAASLRARDAERRGEEAERAAKRGDAGACRLDLYYGQCRDGWATGYGTQAYAPDSASFGERFAGLFDHGVRMAGVFTYPESRGAEGASRYEGDWAKNTPENHNSNWNGYGVVRILDGSVYRGQVHADSMQGYGERTDAHGVRVEGRWVLGKAVEAVRWDVHGRLLPQ